MPVLTGLDAWLARPPAALAGARLGLAANLSATDGSGRPAARALLEAGSQVVRIFAPEHGHDLSFHEGERFGDSRLAGPAIPIVAFYGEGLALTEESVRGLDALVFDLPNVGLRCHTYLANLVETLELSHRLRFPVAILDRPIALGGLELEGPAAVLSPTTDVAPVPVPFRHAMTWLELARWIVRHRKLSPIVHEVPMTGWQRPMWHDATGLPWWPPSPNLPRFESAVAYAATVLLEGTNVSEGRGTQSPFELFGAPWLSPDRLRGALEESGLEGVGFEPARFVPTRSKHTGTACEGLTLRVLDRSRFRPLATGAAILAALARLWPDRLEWPSNTRTGIHFIDRLLGTAELRQAIGAGRPVREVFARFEESASRFARERNECLIYGREEETASCPAKP
ncbi:MAG: DUF1343 domain-containing protein [Candidatus Wallbacteria bacterium]|nr:DUF1343 domain-containing protein [Candidatus Wallbacteria bacterium]